MKLSASTLLVLLPLLAAQASALSVPGHDLVARQFGNQKGRGGGKNFGGNKGQGGKGAAAGGKGAVAGGKATSTTTSAAAANTTVAAGAAAAANSTVAAANNNNGDPQTSLTLDPAVLAKGFEQDGQETPTAGQVASLTSTNNFINFCATTNQPITNGQQITGGSCNPAPMGSIPSSANMPSAKFTNPKNLQDIAANQAFTITMAIQGMETGNFVNAQANYFAAPQQLNGQGQIKGHSHVVVESLSAIDQTTPTDPSKFAFFKGLNAAASGGVLTADVTAGLPAGVYKLSSINTAANHQPVLVPIAQHGSLDDAVYFTVGGAGGGAAAGAGAGAGAGGKGAGAGASTTTTTSSAAATTSAASVKGNGNGNGNGNGKGNGNGNGNGNGKGNGKGQGGRGKFGRSARNFS
jgi:hypothetical protein